MIVPLVWFEESAMMTEELADKFKSKYRDPIRRVNTILFSLLVSSILLFAINLGLLASSHSLGKSYIWRPNKRDKPEKAANGTARPGEMGSNEADLATIKRRDSEVGLIDSQSLIDSDKTAASTTETISSPLLTRVQSSGPKVISALDSPRGALSEQLARNSLDLKPNRGPQLQSIQHSTIDLDNEAPKRLISDPMATTRENL